MKTRLWRVRIAVFATALVGFWSAALFWGEMSAALRDNPDSYKIEEQQSRLAGVAELLPLDATVGYISDVPFGNADGQVYFFVTQYVLAPRLVVEETSSQRQRWVVGNFLKRPDISQLEREHGLKLVKSFGRGVYLFERGS